MGFALLFGLFIITTFALVWVILPLRISGVRRSLESADVNARRLDEEVAALKRRIAALEAGPTSSPAATAAVPSAEPPVVQPVRPPSASGEAPPARPVIRPPAPSPIVAPAPGTVTAAPPPAPPSPPRPAMAPPTVDAHPAVAATAAHTRAESGVSSPSLAAATAARAPVEAGQSETFEVMLGTSWLNKIGVVVFVIGVALLVGYSVMHVGPLGRVAIGYALSMTMLGGGVALGRREMYRNYAYGLVAGGWAGVYFTTYAMHAVDAARIVESEFLGTVALLAVAGGMVAHSIRYRSQTITGLAYVTAYITLLMTPLTGFSLAASVPLAASLIIVSQRFAWTGVSILGLVSTYGLFLVRAAMFPEAVDASGLTAILSLASYWVLFEIADIITLTLRRTAGTPADSPLFALNALGLVGAGLLDPVMSNSVILGRFSAAACVGYLASAVARQRLLVRHGSADAPAQAPGSTHAAIAVAALLAAWSIDLRFSGHRQTLAFLFEAQMAFVAGALLRDRHIRAIGSALAAVTTLHHFNAFDPSRLRDSMPGLGWLATLHTATPIKALLVTSWYANREWMNRVAERHGYAPAYTWTAFVLIALGLAQEVPAVYLGLALAALAALLLELGLRHLSEYRHQGYFAAMAGAAITLVQFAPFAQPPTTQAAWLALGGSAALFYAGAWRLAIAAGLSGASGAAAIASLVGTVLVALLEWRLTPSAAIAPTWAATAAALAGLGFWRRIAALRWQGYGVVGVALFWVSVHLLVPPSPPRVEATAFAVAIALAYIVALVGRVGVSQVPAADRPALASESAVLVLLAAAATATLALFEWRVLPAQTIGFIWSVKASILLAVGLWRGVTDLRWQAYLVFLGAGLRTLYAIAGPDAAQLAGPLWSAMAIGVFFGAGLAAKYTYETTPASDSELSLRSFILIGAAGLLTLLLIDEVRPTLVTLAWGLEGAALLALGFPFRERVLRLSGLALLLLCVLKLFAIDLNELEALARILSFVVLGLVLLAVSWAYTRYREQIRKFL